MDPEVQVWYKNGDTTHWRLHDGMDLRELTKALTRQTGHGVVSFGVRAEDGGSADYDFVGLAMAEVVAWRVSGLFDEASGAALWQELQQLDE